MIRAIVRDNAGNSETLTIDENSTIREALEMAGVDYSKGTTSLDGGSIKAGDLNRTFASYGYSSEEGKNKCYIINVVKTDNAAA